ncbi:MAG: class I SAM-dependent methyltransferase [Planctomycetes bacterium]|nr:class I SAM-dependent methyltransferase [Planctomycetota bacterium]
MQGLQGLLDRIKVPPGPTYNLCRKKLAELVGGLDSGARVLDLGSGGRRLGKQVVSLDIAFAEGVDVVADGRRLPFPDESFDLIVCTGVLEHVVDSGATVGEMYRCCKKGGVVYVEAPFLQVYHGVPSDYRRYTRGGLVEACKPFVKLEAGVCCGPASALSMFLASVPFVLVSSPFLRKACLCLSGWSTFYIKYLDVLLVKLEGAHRLASAHYFMGKKA